MDFVVTDLRSHTKYHFDHAQDMYDKIFALNGGNHIKAAEMCDWAELAPSGDNWTVGDVDVSIEEDD